MNQAKSILGGTLEGPEVVRKFSETPGPGSHNPANLENLPGFRIEKDKNFARRDENDIEKMQKQRDVGPLSYNVTDMKMVKTDHLHKYTIGNSLRTDMVNRAQIPGPGNYQIRGAIEKSGVDNPKFHMGQNVGSFMGKNLDFPGAGEYETDVIPIHHANVAHFIGTGVRSDLGVGKAYMYPGPGEYEYD